MIPALVGPARGKRTTVDDERLTSLALAARDGDHDAVESFIRGSHHHVWRFVAHLSGDTNSADDLAQETFLRALTSLPNFAGRSCARTWLLSIARRVVIDRYRSAAARPRIADVDDWQAVAEHRQPSGLPGFDDGLALRELLDALDGERRQAFVLTQLVGMPYADAAALVGCPVGTVRSRVARARADLTNWLRSAETCARASQVVAA
ncbi:sigma-70 family RNA polymerase sigma factor [Streptomyces sp. NPDC059008]|uniref:sigma-70 family RNA polymerase sigma factor n=1 Tax=Streptomyces sp. NPDC059008 TaxID=3346693 RepID=UPI0036AE27CE